MYNTPQISIFCDKMGSITTDQYDLPLSTAGITPPDMSYIAILISTLGGNLLIQSNDGLIYQFTMVAGREYPVNLFCRPNPTTGQPSVAKILSGANLYYQRDGYSFYTDRSGNRYVSRTSLLDWQGASVTNTITDLTYRGF